MKKKETAEQKIIQIKENALKDIKNTSIKISMKSVEHLIRNSIDNSKIEKFYANTFNASKNFSKKNQSLIF